MGILDFIKKLLPRIQRSQVSEDLRTSQKEMSKIVIPSFEQASEAFRVIKPISEEFKSMQSSFSANFKPNRYARSSSFLSDINNRLKNLLANMAEINRYLDDHIEPDIITSGMTARAAFVIRAASNMSFLSRYMLSMMNYIYSVESQARDIEQEPAIEISKAERKYVEEKFVVFVKLFANYSAEPEEFIKVYQAIPEMIVNDRNSKLLAGLAEAKQADPFGSSGYSGFVGSPIYSVRLAYAQWQNSRYESAKAKKQQLEFRLLYLENQSKDRKDPSLSKEIQRLQDRIEKLDYELSETDKELDL